MNRKISLLQIHGIYSALPSTNSRRNLRSSSKASLTPTGEGTFGTEVRPYGKTNDDRGYLFTPETRYGARSKSSYPWRGRGEKWWSFSGHTRALRHLWRDAGRGHTIVGVGNRRSCNRHGGLRHETH